MAESFGDVLKRLREKRRVSQAKLAERAGCAPSYVSRLESNGRVPSRETVMNLGNALRLSGEELTRLADVAGFRATPSNPLLNELDDLLTLSLPWQVRNNVNLTLGMVKDYLERATKAENAA